MRQMTKELFTDNVNEMENVLSNHNVRNGSFLCLESNLGIPSGTSKLHQLLDNQDPYMMMMAVGHPEGRMEEYDSEGGKDPKSG